MKKILGYLLIVVLGVASIITLMNRSESIDNNMAKTTNTIVLC